MFQAPPSVAAPLRACAKVSRRHSPLQDDPLWEDMLSATSQAGCAQVGERGGGGKLGTGPCARGLGHPGLQTQNHKPRVE